MKIAIIGIDGYIGWALAQYLGEAGHEISGIDSYVRRHLVDGEDSYSVVPISYMPNRRSAFRDRFGRDLFFARGNACDHQFLSDFIHIVRPDTIIDLADISSTVYPQRGLHESCFMQSNNLKSTLCLLHVMKQKLPYAHLVKIGSFGEYGNADTMVFEGNFVMNVADEFGMLPFPKCPASFYHAIKAEDSLTVELACNEWRLRASNLVSGLVYGTWVDKDDEDLNTRCDVDPIFGNIVHRLCAQAVNDEPLNIGDNLQLNYLTPLLALLEAVKVIVESPPPIGEYRVFHQHSLLIDELSIINAIKLNIDAVVEDCSNLCDDDLLPPPIFEMNKLANIGYSFDLSLENDVKSILSDIARYKYCHVTE